MKNKSLWKLYTNKNGLIQKFKPLTFSIKDEFIKRSHPGRGKVTKDKGLKGHQDEIRTAYWLLKNFGGSIRVKLEDNSKEHEGHSNPDYIWNGKWWDLKKPTSKRALDTRLENGFEQLNDKEENARGGFIIDISNLDLDMETIIKRINGRVKASSNSNVIIILRNKSKVVDILRTNK